MYVCKKGSCCEGLLIQLPTTAKMADQSLFLQPETLIGKYISILFQSNVRYEGICHTVDTQSNPPTIILAYVKDCGTEGRGTTVGGFEVPPKDYLLEHMIFLVNKIVRMKILAVPHWNLIDIESLPAQEYHRMLLHYSTLNLMSPNLIYTLDEYGPVLHPMSSSKSNISIINQMTTPIFGSHLNANVQNCPTSKGKSVVLEPPADVKGKSIQIPDPTGKGKSIMDTGIEEIASLVDMYKDQTIRSLHEYRNGNNASPMNQTEDTFVLPSFFGDLRSSVEAIISENEPLQEVSSSEKKITGHGAIGSSSTLGRGN